MTKLKFLFSVVGMLLAPISLFAFTFSVVTTPETCAGNATLTFSAAAVDPAGTIEYFVYKLPDTVVPYATVTSTNLSGLTGGDYLIIAKESVNNVVTSQQQQNVTIVSSVQPLQFTVISQNQTCATTSTITVNVTSGVASNYEIFFGPVLFPVQTSNTFSNLPVGVYKIRVFDACGIGVVSTFNVLLNPTGLSVTNPVYSLTNPPSCNSIIATQTITPNLGTVISYPLTIKYTIHPPGGGADIIYNQIISTGSSASIDVLQQIPTYNNQIYNYDIEIMDACNAIHNSSFLYNHSIIINPTVVNMTCNNLYIRLNIENFTPPYTLTFNSMPTGFNPVLYNSSYPIFSSNLIEFGSTTQFVPFGFYDISLIDSCGNIANTTFNFSTIIGDVLSAGFNNGCTTNSGKIVINIPNFNIGSAIITSAPASYPFTLPHDVSSQIGGAGQLILTSVPIGDYTFDISDACGTIYLPENVTVPAYVDQGLDYDQRPGCDLGFGSLHLFSNNAKLTAVTITAAPSGFPYPLPYTATTHIIADGNWYMNGLPGGSYTILGVDECGFSNTISLVLKGYSITQNTYNVQSNCGTFDLTLNFSSNANTNQKFWLQKLIDPVLGIWGNPTTNVPYVSGIAPDMNDSYLLSNSATNYNLNFNGEFRIIRTFSSYVNGSDVNSGTLNNINGLCFQVLTNPTFVFDEVLDFIDANRMPCSPSGSLDVVLDVKGKLPLHYTIIDKDGVSFFLDNGTSDVFYNLPPAIYTFQVQDDCGNIVNRIFDVNSLVSIVRVTKPNDIVVCQSVLTGNETYDISLQSPIILGTQSPSLYTLTYHENITDAQNATNALSNLATYNPTNNPQTVYARLHFNALPNCYEITSFDVFAGQIPSLNLDATYLKCNANSVTVSAATTNLPITTYSWSDGTAGTDVTVTQLGQTLLTATATNSYGLQNVGCAVSQDITVNLSSVPTIEDIKVVDWTTDENSITVVASDPTWFEYALNSGSFQDNNVFDHLPADLYTVTIQDKLGCGSIEQDVWILNYPKFFTPNGDGFNDVWKIKNSELEPNLRVYLYDRQGKLIKYLDAEASWNGTYTGQQLPADDYWFVAIRQDGRRLTGNFSIKR
jgi:gliding motility-associated-like protein